MIFHYIHKLCFDNEKKGCISFVFTINNEQPDVTCETLFKLINMYIKLDINKSGFIKYYFVNDLSPIAIF